MYPMRIEVAPHSMNGIDFVFEIDRDGNNLTWNQVGGQLTGRTRNEGIFEERALLNQVIGAILDIALPDLTPDNFARLITHMVDDHRQSHYRLVQGEDGRITIN